MYLLRTSNFLMMLSIKTFWGATCPRFTGILEEDHSHSKTQSTWESRANISTLKEISSILKRSERKKAKLVRCSQSIYPQISSVKNFNSYPTCLATRCHSFVSNTSYSKIFLVAILQKFCAIQIRAVSL